MKSGREGRGDVFIKVNINLNTIDIYLLVLFVNGVYLFIYLLLLPT